MPFNFRDDAHNRYYKSLADALKLEFNFTKQVAAGQAQGRQDVTDKFIKNIQSGLGIFAQLPFAGVGIEIVKCITHLIERHRDSVKKQQRQGFIESLLRCDSSRQYEAYINNIAREVTFRYGVSLTHLLHRFKDENNTVRMIDMLAHVASLRIMFYALTEAISIEYCEALVNGLIDGYEGLQGTELIHIFNKISLLEKVTGDGSNMYTAEGFYANCGYVVPVGFQYLFHIDRNQGNQYVAYLPVEQSKTDRKPPSRDILVPKYGYALASKLPTSTHFPDELGRHYPNASNPFVNAVKFNYYHFVSNNQLEKYLESANGKVHTKDFATWLKMAYPNLYGAEVIYPIYRGTINEDNLRRAGLSFTHGLFRDCDFSFCTFRNVYFSQLTHCMLIGSEFNSCSASGNALSGSDFTLARMSNCNFQKLVGIIYANYSTISMTYFNGSNIQFQFEGAIVDQVSTDSFADCRTEIRGSSENLGILIKESMLIHEKKSEERRAEEARRQAERDAAQQSWNVTIEEQLASVRRIVLEREAADAEKTREDGNKSPAPYEMNEEEREKIYAFHKTTIEESIQKLTTVVTEDNILAKLFDTLFFTKPSMLLRELAKAPKNMVWSNIERKMNYSVAGLKGPNGTAGEDGENGNYGGGAGSDAHDGLDGQPGTAAGSIAVSVTSVANQNVFLVTPKAANPMMLPLFDSATAVHLTARGGDGGEGGKGGKGGDGSPGIDGTDATTERVGTNGTNGGNGGKGGNGGHGGNAGLSGNIEIYVKEADIDLLACIETCDVSEARGGRGGAFGVGGTGGNGGRGGKSATKTIETRNGDGTTSYSYITLPGGAPGARGRPGNDGKSGADGLNGRAGKVTFFVIPETGGNVEEFSKLFDLRLFQYADFVSKTGIIEPGQRLVVRNIRLSNAGGMTTPKNRIEITLIPSSMVEVDDKTVLVLQDAIPPNETLTLPNEVKFDFKVSRTTVPERGVVFQTDAKVTLTATVCRLKRILKNFDASPKTIQIRYPVELSITRGALTLTVGKRVPFTVKVRNVSLVSLGTFAENPRRLRVEISIPYGDYSTLDPHYHVEQDAKCTEIFSLENPIVCDINYLAAGEEYTICGTLSIQNLPSDRAYERLPIEVSLKLGDLDNPMALSTLATIQRETFSLQLAEGLRLPIIANDLLLVANHTTTKQEISHWETIANDLQMQLNVWNISMYYGFTYFHEDVSVVECMKNGLVVFLNFPCNRDDNPKYFDDTFHPLEFMAMNEIFEAARRHGIRTYIINKTKSPTHAFPIVFPNILVPYAGLSRKQGIQRVIDNPFIEIPAKKDPNAPPAVKKNSSSSKKIRSDKLDKGEQKEEGKRSRTASRSSFASDISIRPTVPPEEPAAAPTVVASAPPAPVEQEGEQKQEQQQEEQGKEQKEQSEQDQQQEQAEPSAPAEDSSTSAGEPSAPPMSPPPVPPPPPVSPAPSTSSPLSPPPAQPQTTENEEDEEEEEEPAGFIGNNIDITTINELEFISRSDFYQYLSWLKSGGREELLSQHYQYISIRQTRLFTFPDTNALRKRLNAFISKLEKLCPTRQYFFYPIFLPSKIENSGTFFPRYIVGEIELRRGLDNNYAMIANRNRLDKSILSVETDKIVLIKLLPFRKKLEMFNEFILSTNPLHGILGNMIVSDIVDEQYILLNYFDRRSQNDQIIATWSVTFNIFAKFDFHALCQENNSKGRTALSLILQKLRILYERYPKKLFRTSRMQFYCHHKIESMRTLYFPNLSVEDFQKSANEWYSSNGRLSFELLIKFLRDPYKLNDQQISFNHWQLPKESILTDANAKMMFSPNVKAIQPDRFAMDNKSSGNENGFFSNYCSFRTANAKVYPKEDNSTTKEAKNGKGTQIWYHGTHGSIIGYK